MQEETAVRNLKDWIKEHGFRPCYIYNSLGLAPGTYYNKVYLRRSHFTQEEQKKIIDMTHMTKEDAAEVFAPYYCCENFE